jgi:hypothetical protein
MAAWCRPLDGFGAAEAPRNQRCAFAGFVSPALPALLQAPARGGQSVACREAGACSGRGVDCPLPFRLLLEEKS